jgi:hypothetical protein
MIEQYIKMMEELKTLGEQIMKDDEITGFEPWFNEVDRMTEQFEVSLSFLKKIIVE